MGGAPPPPLDAAPQAPKIRRNSGPWRPGWRRNAGPRIASRQGGEGGSRPLPKLAHPGPWWPGFGSFVQGAGSGAPVWRRFEPTGRRFPRSRGTARAVLCGFAQGRRAKRIWQPRNDCVGLLHRRWNLTYAGLTGAPMHVRSAAEVIDRLRTRRIRTRGSPCPREPGAELSMFGHFCSPQA